MDILSIVLGVLSLVTAFTPLIWLQVVGGFVGIAGIVLARKAKKADYRKSLTTAIGRDAAVLPDARALPAEQRRPLLHDALTPGAPPSPSDRPLKRPVASQQFC